MSEIESLLNELRNMKSSDRAAYIANNKENWSKIGTKDLESLGFETEEELKEFILSNPYANI